MKLEVTWVSNEEKQHASIGNVDYNDGAAFEDWYVNFGGYFGNINPSVFAAAPDLLAALDECLAEWERATLHYEWTDEPEGMVRARAAIAKAKGLTK